MEKVNYRISVRKSADKNPMNPMNMIPGYVFNIGNVRFGVSNVGIDGKKHDVWTITELTTGYKIIDGYNRKNAIDELVRMPKAKWEYMKEVVSKCIENLNETIQPKYDIYSAY